MFTPKTYILVCHGCGKFHEKVSEFISVPQTYGFDDPNNTQRRWSIPALGCPECMALKPANRDDHPIYKAFRHGMTPDAAARAKREFTEWLPKLEARHNR